MYASKCGMKVPNQVFRFVCPLGVGVTSLSAGAAAVSNVLNLAAASLTHSHICCNQCICSNKSGRLLHVSKVVVPLFPMMYLSIPSMTVVSRCQCHVLYICS